MRHAVILLLVELKVQVSDTTKAEKRCVARIIKTTL